MKIFDIKEIESIISMRFKTLSKIHFTSQIVYDSYAFEAKSRLMKI